MKALHIAKAIATILPMMTAPAFAGAFSQPTGLAVNSSGSLYVANQLSSKVLVFDKNFAAQPQLTITAGSISRSPSPSTRRPSSPKKALSTSAISAAPRGSRPIR